MGQEGLVCLKNLWLLGQLLGANLSKPAPSREKAREDEEDLHSEGRVAQQGSEYRVVVDVPLEQLGRWFPLQDVHSSLTAGVVHHNPEDGHHSEDIQDIEAAVSATREFGEGTLDGKVAEPGTGEERAEDDLERGDIGGEGTTDHRNP